MSTLNEKVAREALVESMRQLERALSWSIDAGYGSEIQAAICEAIKQVAYAHKVSLDAV